MLVEIDETGKDRATGAIDDVLRRPIDVADRDNPLVVQEDVTTHHATFLVLRDDESTAEKKGHREPSMGRAVERVFAALRAVEDANEAALANLAM